MRVTRILVAGLRRAEAVAQGQRQWDGDISVSLNNTEEHSLAGLRRRWVWALLPLLWACAFPEERVVTGVLTRIERRQDLETVCHAGIRVRDPNSCHEPPVCCSYRVTVRDSTGHQEYFYAFWPDYAPGLKWVELRRVSVHLHRQEITEFPCSMYGCRTFLDYALQSDDDWKVLE